MWDSFVLYLFIFMIFNYFSYKLFVVGISVFDQKLFLLTIWRPLSLVLFVFVLFCRRYFSFSCLLVIDLTFSPVVISRLSVFFVVFSCTVVFGDSVFMFLHIVSVYKENFFMLNRFHSAPPFYRVLDKIFNLFISFWKRVYFRIPILPKSSFKVFYKYLFHYRYNLFETVSYVFLSPYYELSKTPVVSVLWFWTAPVILFPLTNR